MKLISKCILILLSVSLCVPVLADTPRIMLLGDSWAWFMFLNKSIERALEKKGYEEWSTVGMRTAIPGSTSAQWIQEDWLENISKELERYPTVDIIHLSLGGNDYLRRWSNDMPQKKRDELFNGVVSDVRVIIKHILKDRPDMRIVICSYDYVNASRKNSSVKQLNQAGQILEGMKSELCKEFPDNVYHINNYGLMQYYFGVDPGLPAESVPMPVQYPEYKPGGNPDFGSGKVAMSDKIHLSGIGYKVLGEFCVDTIYGKLLDEKPVAAASEEEK